jgi:serine phosphatase RsbU (regulator of sigma subunit)
MTVSLIVGTLRTLAETTSDPAAILAGLNRRLHGRLRHGFATCIVLHLDGDGNCTLANAGHLAPFLNTTELELPPALPLGLDPSATYESVLIPLDIHARLTLYTDGLLEARKPTGELFGFDRLQQLMAASPTAESAVQTAVAFGQDDDITVLTLTRLAVGIASTTTLSAPTLAEFSTVGVYS